MKKNLTLLIAAVPLDIYKKMQRKFKARLDDCSGLLECYEHEEVWYGFIKKTPYKVTYKPRDSRTYWTPCDLEFVKQKLKSTAA
jgi:hypothetical protein